MREVHIRKSRKCLMCRKRIFVGDVMLCGSIKVEHDFTPSGFAYKEIDVCSDKCLREFQKTLLFKSLNQLYHECNCIQQYSDISQMTLDGPMKVGNYLR